MILAWSLYKAIAAAVKLGEAIFGCFIDGFKLAAVIQTGGVALLCEFIWKIIKHNVKRLVGAAMDTFVVGLIVHIDYWIRTGHTSAGKPGWAALFMGNDKAFFLKNKCSICGMKGHNKQNHDGNVGPEGEKFCDVVTVARVGLIEEGTGNVEHAIEFSSNCINLATKCTKTMGRMKDFLLN
ncbi:hypothetical protein M885DRAFT_556756 [Pelagophyceae sp. CCMP2097]|nr:hypothetical protein M885DRAFT_556756 [Pelagophyceae sp. CCMP2097]